MRLKLDHLESGQKEMKSEIKELSNRIDRKFDRMDTKVDRVLYVIISSLFAFALKGGYDERKKSGRGAGTDEK